MSIVGAGPEYRLAAGYGSRAKAKTWLGRSTLKFRRSNIAICTARNFSATATTKAAAVPSGRLAYRSTRTAAHGLGPRSGPARLKNM